MNRLAPLRRSGWIPLVALGVAWLLAATPVAGRLESLIGDFQQRLAAQTLHFTGAVVVDLDEDSLEHLKPYFGTWPYNRDAYALVVDWLNEQGAKAVVLDIVLADPRPKDDVLARSLTRWGNVVLVATTPAPHDHPLPTDSRRGAPLGWRVSAGMPVQHWSTLLLPDAALLRKAADTVVGVVGTVADADGVLRRLPLAHEAAGAVLPNLPIAALKAAQPPQKRALHVLTAGLDGWGLPSRQWPVDADGFLHIYFPANASPVLSMSFYEVAEAALGVTDLKNANRFFKGKTVFIGSTAHLADRVTTPRGPMSGTYALAIAHQTLSQGLVWHPPGGAWRALLPVLALIGLYGMVLSAGKRWVVPFGWLAGSAVVVYGLNFLLLKLAMQQTALLLPLLMLVVGGGLHSATERIALHRLVRKLEQEADLDSLTGLPVRRAFLRGFHLELAYARRYQIPLSVAILDLDHFKRVNDTYGHPVGDLVLKTFARVLTTNVRASDRVGRWGGEEFVVVLPNTDADGAVVVLDKLRRAISEEAFPSPAADLVVTTSAGVTAVRADDENAEEIVGRADLALYQAKEAGRNRVCMCEPVVPVPSLKAVGTSGA